jgi:four helix bundle protein
MSYKKLEIWKLARALVVDIHRMTLEELPKFELYEEGSQIRKSSKSVKSTIVEGYGRRRYKAEYIKFLTYAIASNDETIDHLENLFDTGSLKDEMVFQDLHKRLNVLGKKINLFIQSVETGHLPAKLSCEKEHDRKTSRS